MMTVLLYLLGVSVGSLAVVAFCAYRAPLRDDFMSSADARYIRSKLSA